MYNIFMHKRKKLLKDVVRRCALSQHVLIAPALKVQHKHLLCSSDLLTTNTVIVYAQVSGISGNMLEMFFKRWDPRGTLRCNNHLNSSYPVYIVQTTGGDTRSTQSVCVSLTPFASHIWVSLFVWSQRQASSASSLASQRCFSKCFLSPQSSRLRAQPVSLNKTIF